VSKQLIYITFLVGLFFTVTNFVPVSVLPFVVAFLLVPFALLSMLLRLPKINRIMLWGSVFYLISIVSLFFYSPESLVTPEFYRYDGNFLITFLPVLVMPYFYKSVSIDLERQVKIFVVISILVSSAIVAIQIIQHIFVHGLFVAHNAFGGFLMTVIAFAYTWNKYTKRKLLPIIFLGVGVALLVLSVSRGSILGLVGGVFALWCVANRKGWILASAIIMIVILQSTILFYTYPVYRSMHGEMQAAYSDAASGEDANILIRAYENWPRGLYLFLHSPIIGAGVGSVNDVPIVLNEDSVFQFNKSGHKIYNSAHAHNTYINILAEQGIIGLAVFLMFWRAIYQFILRHEGSTIIREGLIISFWALTFASFTENRIPSPSNAFPFIIILFLWSSTRYKKAVDNHYLHAESRQGLFTNPPTKDVI
jgi:O-antigen ligase